MSLTKVKLANNAAGLSKQDFDAACQRADDNFAALTKKTVKVVIGAAGVAGCDYNLPATAATTAKAIVLTSIIPALGRVVDVLSHTKTAFVFSGGANTLVCKVGSAAGGEQYIASATVYAADAITAIAVGSNCVVAPVVAASDIHLTITPGANWSTLSGGVINVYVTYIDVSGL